MEGKNSLSPAQALSFGIPEELAKFAEIVDQQEFDVPVKTKLVIVRTIPDWRDLYIKHLIQKDSKGVATAEQIARLKKKHCILDTFDGGIVYQIFDDESKKPRMIRRTFDYPREESIAKSLVEKYFQKRDFGNLYEWLEATILSVFTINGKTFFSTRSKIDCSRSKSCQDVNCPTMLKIFENACENHGINIDAFKTEGVCHVLILRDPWNQITNTGLEKSTLIHHASYDFSEEGVYKQVEKKFEGIPSRTNLTKERAIEIIQKGGIVVEDGDFANMKIMSQDTASLYETLKSGSISPILEYFKLLSTNNEKAAEFLSIVNPYSKQKIEQYLQDETVLRDNVIEYLYWRLILKLTNPDEDKKQKVNKRIDSALKFVMISYASAKDAEKGKKGKQKKKFLWGGTTKTEELNQKNSFMDYLMKLRNENGGEYYCLLRDCKVEQKSEKVRQEKRAKAVTEDKK